MPEDTKPADGRFAAKPAAQDTTPAVSVPPAKAKDEDVQPDRGPDATKMSDGKTSTPDPEAPVPALDVEVKPTVSGVPEPSPNDIYPSLDQDDFKAPKSKKEANGMTRMEKDGVTAFMHPSTVQDHLSVGWVVAKDED